MYAFLCDIHLGCNRITNQEQLDSLDILFDKIRNHKEECNIIFVCGDLFDHRLSLDELKFASTYLMKLCYNELGRTRINVPVHFIHGTYSHDYDQYDIFLPMLNKIPDIEIFYTKEWARKTLRNGKRVLYLPQQYGDIDYENAFDHKYDIIIGHGPISSQTHSPCPSGNNEITLPVETLNELSNICVFGHYHQFTTFDNTHVLYAGTNLRWVYGEDETKRFVICDDSFNIETFVNPIAKEYKTIIIDNPEQLRDVISNDITTPTRFFISTNNNDVELNTYHAIMETNKNNSNISFKITTIENDDTDNSLKLNEMSNDIKVHDPIPSLIDYIKEKYDTDVSTQIHEYETKIMKE